MAIEDVVKANREAETKAQEIVKAIKTQYLDGENEDVRQRVANNLYTQYFLSAVNTETVTNADMIKAMDTEELAKYIVSLQINLMSQITHQPINTLQPVANETYDKYLEYLRGDYVG